MVAGRGMDWEFGFVDATIIYRMDKQQDPDVQYRKLYSVRYDKP